MTKLRNRNKTKKRHYAIKRRSHKTRSQRGGDWLHTLSFGYAGTPPPLGLGSGTNPVAVVVDQIDTGIGNVATTLKDEASKLTGEASKLTGEATNKVFKLKDDAQNYILGTGSDTNNTLIGSPLPTPDPTPDPTPPSPVNGIGGKSRKYKKGGANLGLLYYATPVTPVNSVEQITPITPIKGGKKHKYTCCKNKRKGKRHRHNASCSRK